MYTDVYICSEPNYVHRYRKKLFALLKFGTCTDERVINYVYAS